MDSGRILIVDDEESILRLLNRLCRSAGYQVETAENGQQALEALRQNTYDVCIADLRLPDSDGITILRAAKQLQSGCEVIILTGHGDVDTAVEALRLGAYDYLQKPIFDLQLIPLTISRAIERQHLARHNARLLQDLQRANRELDYRRKQQIQAINQIGQALSASLQTRDVADVLIHAMLGAVNCDAAAMLLLRKNGDPAWAMVGARRTLSLRARNELVLGMLERLPEEVRPVFEGLRTVELAPSEPGEIDDAVRRREEYASLVIRDELIGMVVIATHDRELLTEESASLFEILVNQGSAALANARLFARARELATKDSLTGLYNHGHFFELLNAEASRAERHGQELAVIMLDIDRQHGLKAINDTYGHQAGDELLCSLARLLEHNLRRADIVARYGGDEFIIMAPQTGQEKALALAERLAQRLRETPFIFGGQEEHITISLGVAVFKPGANDSASNVVSRADKGLYLAKDRGGNQVCMIED